MRVNLARDWSEVESLKRRYWAEAFAASALRTHVRSIRPEWPSAAERDADLDHHVALKRLLDRAARGAAR